MMMKEYYPEVESYYDDDAGDFDRRYWENPVLQKMRQSFREEVKRHRFTAMLEIGYGTGLDMIHFGQTHPNAKVYGVDISAEMCRLTQERVKSKGLENVFAAKGSVEDINRIFPDQQYDMIYVFFGALNTVEDLRQSSLILQELLLPGGIMVLTFVNKYYIAGMVLEMMKLRFSNAFARLRKFWGGYSPVKKLPSRCYSPSQIRETFREMKLLRRRGFCIKHPAWYYHGLNQKLKRMSPLFWKFDLWLNHTTFWKFGEYTLFVFQKA
jgi:ubiquinone/menaquinone biosynthesis C-methylase UbiE